MPRAWQQSFVCKKDRFTMPGLLLVAHFTATKSNREQTAENATLRDLSLAPDLKYGQSEVRQLYEQNPPSASKKYYLLHIQSEESLRWLP
jgi:hypothetical protein